MTEEYEFTQDTTIERIDQSSFNTTITDRWNITTVPCGGYVMAILARALGQHLPHPDPFSITGHFFKPIAPGPARIEVETMKSGKSISFGQAKLIQDGEERLRVTAAYGDLDQRNGLNHSTRTMADIPPFDECITGKIPMNFFHRINAAFSPESGRWLRGEHDENCEIAGWISFADNCPIDALALVLFADAFPPPIFRKAGPTGWVPTLELTVQIRGKPAPGPLRCRFATRSITEGYAEEDGEIWDSQGNLVALSRQLESIRFPG